MNVRLFLIAVLISAIAALPGCTSETPSSPEPATGSEALNEGSGTTVDLEQSPQGSGQR